MRNKLFALLVSTVILFGTAAVYSADAAELVLIEQSFAGLSDTPDGWTVMGIKDTNYSFNADCIAPAPQAKAYVKAYHSDAFDTEGVGYNVSFNLGHYSGSSSFVHIGGKQISDVISNYAAASGYSIQFTTKDYKKAIINLYKNGDIIGTLTDKQSDYAYQGLRRFEFTVSDDRVTLSGAGDSITITEDEPIYSGYLGIVLYDTNNSGRTKLSQIKLNKLLEAAPDTALYISAESTDKYNKYQTVTDKCFKEIDAYKQLNDFTISENHTFLPKGLVFESAGELVINKELSGDYIMNIGLTADSGSVTRVIWSMQNSENYAYLESDADGMKLAVTENGAENIIAESYTDDISGKLAELKLELESGHISVYCTADNTVTEVFKDISVPFTGGKTGVRFISGGGSVKLVQIWRKNEECYSGTIDGCMVSYKNFGKCTIMAAFYNGDIFDSVYLTETNITKKGNNYFSIPINSDHSLQGFKRKYFVFDSLNNLMPLVELKEISSYREGTFSDELEPYYQHTTAQTRTATEMIKRIRGGKMPNVDISDEELTTDELPGGERYEVVDMFRKAGIDLSLDLETYVFSSILKNNMPQRFSRLTPKSLTGAYEQPYSVDAPWNNKIPEDNPSMLLDSWNSMNMTVQIGTVKNRINQDGNGIGIPVIIGDKSDPEYTLLCKYGTNTNGLHGHLIKAPEHVIDYTNNQTTSDNHAIFINGETKTSLQTMGICPPEYEGGYSLDKGLMLNYDARATATSAEIDLTGIANEGRTGTNAISMPMEAFMIRKQELAEDGEINHAIAGALGNMMKARAYPALSYDYWVRNAATSENITGNVPYGAIVRLASDLPLEELYESGTLSSPSYKLLKAWRDYGFYNIDCSGSSADKIVLYTATENSDWNYTAPHSGNMGIAAIEQEIKAFLAGDAYFGLEGKPLYYLTVPVVKYTELDVTLDGTVDEADYNAVEAVAGAKPEFEKVRYDVNKDGIIDENDSLILANFLSGTAYHKDSDYKVTAQYTEGGTIWIDNKTPKHGQWVSISASPDNGYRFAGWEGEFADETKNVIHVKADRDITVKAIYEQLDYCTFDLTIEGDGAVRGSTDKISYTSPIQSQYRKNTQMAFKAFPAEGWIFDHWEYKGNYYFDVIDVVIQEDTAIKAVFRKPDFFDEFSAESLSEDWEAYSSGNKPDTADFGLRGGMLQFYDWSESLMTVVNKNIILSENESFVLTTAGKITATGGGNEGMILFAYNSEKDYYCIEFDKNMVFRLQRVQNGKRTTLQAFEIDSKVNIYSWMTFRIEYSPQTGLDIRLYQNFDEYTLLENYQPDDLISGKFGLGSRYCGAVGFDKFILYKESEVNE